MALAPLWMPDVVGGQDVTHPDRVRVTADTFYHTYSAAHPVLHRLRPGSRIVTRLLDSGGVDEFGVPRARSGNPLTGPFYVEGAEAGDALVIRLERVRLLRDWGYTSYRLELGSLTPQAVESIYPARHEGPPVCPEGCEDLVRWQIDIEEQNVRLAMPESTRLAFEFAARPMVGSIGVAPVGDYAPRSVEAGSYGGNMDYNQIREGTTVILPVFHSGAFLFLGDGHALQADGEGIGGVETAVEVQFTVNVDKGLPFALLVSRRRRTLRALAARQASKVRLIARCNSPRLTWYIGLLPHTALNRGRRTYSSA